MNLTWQGKVGIAVDNYKVAKFKEELIKEGFGDFVVFRFTKDTQIIQVINVTQEKAEDIKRLCKRLELHFKRSN